MTLTKDERKDVANIFQEISELALEAAKAVRKEERPAVHVIALVVAIQDRATLSLRQLVRDIVD